MAELEFNGSSGEFVFNPGDESACFMLAAIDDSVVEDNETLDLTLEIADRALLPLAEDAVVTILDNDGKVLAGKNCCDNCFQALLIRS